MNGSQKSEVELFTEAVQLPAEKRPAFLTAACGGDVQLREHVEALLRAHTRAGEFLEEIPAEVKARSGLPAQKPGDRIGRYKLLEQIGEGGCGVVFKAQQEEPVHRTVALKVVKLGMDTRNVIARFEAERQALALMDHPNIAKVFDAGATESGRPYFVMELVDGVKITDYCDQNALTTKERLNIFIQVCKAVQHAHQKGVIHRDLKPSNILVTKTSDGSPAPVIIDFGIAKATTNQRLTDKTLFTALEMLIGTPAYMSPEQAVLASADVDTRSDIYSLGVLLYELLIGSTPFDAGELLKAGLDEVRRVIREKEPVCPSTRLKKMTNAELTTLAQRRRSEPPTLIRAVRGDLDWIVMKALEKEPARRYETASGLALDVQRFLADEPIAARPPSRLYKFQKMALRNKLLFSGLVLLAGLVTVSLIIVSASLSKARVALRQSEAAKTTAQTEAFRSQQITRFLEDMLQSVGPSVALGQDTRMLRGILDRTAQRVGNEMTNQPAVEAHLRSLLGQLYFEIGIYDLAEGMQSASLAIDRDRFGPNSAEAARGLEKLGVTFWREGKQAQAEAAQKEALAIRRRRFGENSAEVATSLNNLGNVYRHYQKPAEAEPLTREALDIRQKLFGKDSLRAADSLRVLSILLGDEGKPAEAEAMAREVLAIRRTRLGPEDPLIAESLADIAWAAGKQGKWEEVESLQRQALAMRQNLLSEAHPATIDSLHNLCATLEGRGKYADAEGFHREALAFWTQRGGIEEPQALTQLDALTRDLLVEKKFSEAEQVLDEALTPAFVSRPSSAQYLRMRIGLLGRRRQWPEATSDAVLLLKYQPAEHYNYHLLTGLLAITNDRRAYGQLCRRIIATFAGTTNHYIAERMAQDCLLLPDSGVDLQVADRMSDTSLAGGGELPFSQICKAMSSYRLERYPEAMEWAQKALNSTLVHAQAKAYAILAMARWKLGQKDVARAMLTKGNPLAIETSPGHDTGEPLDWLVGWLFARVSLDEAAALIQPAASNENNPNKP